MSLESVLHVSVLTPTSGARDRPVRMALYLTWLLDVLKAKWRDFSMRMSLGPSKTMRRLPLLGLKNHQRKVSTGFLRGFVADR